jgi:hypothetical protein
MFLHNMDFAFMQVLWLFGAEGPATPNGQYVVVLASPLC